MKKLMGHLFQLSVILIKVNKGQLYITIMQPLHTNRPTAFKINIINGIKRTIKKITQQQMILLLLLRHITLEMYENGFRGLKDVSGLSGGAK
jgi:hypothetical protein